MAGSTLFYVLKEALFVGFLVDDKGVIHIPAPEPGVGVGAVLRAFCSKYSMYKLATMGLNWRTHGSTLNLFIELALEREVSVFETELQ